LYFFFILVGKVVFSALIVVVKAIFRIYCLWIEVLTLVVDTLIISLNCLVFLYPFSGESILPFFISLNWEVSISPLFLYSLLFILRGFS